MPVFQSPDNQRAPFRLLALGHILLIAATWRLWTPQTDFPQIPLFDRAGECPRIFEWLLLCVLLVSLAVIYFAMRPNIRRSACLTSAICSLGLIFVDQHRLQPWAWEFLIVSFVLAFANSFAARQGWRWLVIGIYGWSAWSKFDYGFCLQHGPFLLEGICKSLHLPGSIWAWPELVRFGLSGAIPLFELMIAVGLWWSRTRRLALVGAAIMHLGLLLALGPLGHNHKPGVLVWNIFFLVQNWVLFGRHASPTQSTEQDCRDAISTNGKGSKFHWGSGIARAIICAALVWPIAEPYGLCDHWPAWAVYAAKPERVRILLHKDELASMPSKLIPYLSTDPSLEEWSLLRIDRWSLVSLNVPIYPQDRFQVGVALEVLQQYDLKQMQIIIESSANRWNGERRVYDYEGVEAIEHLARSYRINALPRAR